MVRLVVVVNTLLGPEGTGRTVVWGFFWMGRLAWPGPRIPRTRCVWSGGGFGVVGGLFVENCTVDASIFVVKLSRANGGCLGTRSR